MTALFNGHDAFCGINGGPCDCPPRVTVFTSAGADGAIVVQIDTVLEPDGSTGGRPVRVNVNDGTVFGPEAEDEDLVVTITMNVSLALRVNVETGVVLTATVLTPNVGYGELASVCSGDATERLIRSAADAAEAFMPWPKAGYES